MTNETREPVYVGIDVSKDSLEVALADKAASVRFANDEQGVKALLEHLAGHNVAVVLLEAPHRIEALAQALAVLGKRPITLGRELTKQFEQIETLPAQDLSAWLAEKPERLRGEFVLVLHDAPVDDATGEGLRVLQLLLPELPLKTAVKLAAEISGESKNTLYEQALALKNQG